jgi:hypothetical protein
MALHCSCFSARRAAIKYRRTYRQLHATSWCYAWYFDIPSPNTTVSSVLWPPSIALWGSLVPPYTLLRKLPYVRAKSEIPNNNILGRLCTHPPPLPPRPGWLVSSIYWRTRAGYLNRYQITQEAAAWWCMRYCMVLIKLLHGDACATAWWCMPGMVMHADDAACWRMPACWCMHLNLKSPCTGCMFQFIIRRVPP